VVGAIGLVHVGQTPLPIDFAYDSLDQLVKTRTPKPSSSNYLATYFSYDAHGNTETLEDNREETSGGSSVTAGRVMSYTYNNLDQATGQIDDYASGGTSDDEQLLYTYTDRGELDTQTLQKGGTGAWATEQSAVRTYFWNGQLKTLTNKNAAGSMIEQHTLSYIQSGVYMNGNRVGDVFQLKGPDGAAACYSATCTASWTYDARDRLTQEVNGTGVTTSYTLDPVGNVTGEAPSTGAATTRTYSGQQLATQTSSGTTVKFLYDAYGNQDCKVKSTYAGTTCPGSGADLLEDWVYDYKSRLAGYRSYNGSGTLVTSVDYVNDPLDRPVSQSTTTSGSTTNYAFRYIGATDLLSTETLTGATSATRKYAYDAQGRRVTMADGANRYSYQYDPHGSVSLLLDQTGAPKASYAYDAYGNANSALTKTAAGFTAATNAYRYTGKRLDTGSTTLDMGARRYLPATGRFL
jgi:RHS repeat-associated protein